MSCVRSEGQYVALHSGNLPLAGVICRGVHGDRPWCRLGSHSFMTALVRIALRRPYTFVVLALSASDHRPARRLAHARRHLSGNPHPGDRGDLAVYRPAAGRDGRPHGDAVRARAHDDRQRHRAYRGQLLHRRRHRQIVLPARCRHSHRECAGHRDLADPAEEHAARRHAAADSQLQRVDRADHPARACPARACPSRRCSISA